MTRLALVFCAFLIVCASTGAAQSVKLSAEEIATLLTGNTAVGRWSGKNYRQYFAADGTTIYAQHGARSTRGSWRIDVSKQEYQSTWPGDQSWEGWFVMEYDGTFYWVSKATPPTPFKVLSGQQLVATDCQALRRFAAGGKAPALFGEEPLCSRSRVLGGAESYDCRWEFAYRSDRARSGFSSLVELVQACTDSVSVNASPGVNHPDSYQQIGGMLNDAEITLSLKDKSALSQTLVFLKRVPTSGN